MTAALFIVGGAHTASAENFLLNSSFNLATNQATPDDWDLGHAAGLQFRDLHSQYNLDDSLVGPVAGVRVLKITNSLSGFPFLYLLSRVPESKFVAGDYVFSVYVKADRPLNTMDISPTLDHMELRTSRRVTTEWQRYSAEFHVDAADGMRLSPMLVLLDRGTYWISAPQLESGAAMTAYAPSALDATLGEKTPAQRHAAAVAVADIASATELTFVSGPQARFEFDIYTDETTARLEATAGSESINATVECALTSSGDLKPTVLSSAIVLAPRQSQVIEIPIAHLDPGEHSCEVRGGGRVAVAKFSLLTPSPLVVRVNQWRNTLDIDKVGYHIRGIMVGDVVPPEWYFADIVDHGINTLLYCPRTQADGSFDTHELDAALHLAGKYGMKVIVGPPVMGEQDGTWKSRLDRYADMVRRYRTNSTIMGWWVVDEPRAQTLQHGDLINIYARLKAIDPSRLVFINWGSDDVPAGVGVEPFGSLSATDLYSIDYYPFANSNTNMETFTLRTIRMLRSAAGAARPGHSWLQLYGAIDVSREPTGDELNYLAYVNLLFGGNYSYWNIRSNAKPTWDRVRRTNREIDTLMGLLWFNPAAHELKPATLMGNYLYSAWKTETGSYLIVLHVADRTEHFGIELTPIFGAKILEVTSCFDASPGKVVGSALRDTFSAYAVKVYKIH